MFLSFPSRPNGSSMPPGSSGRSGKTNGNNLRFAAALLDVRTTLSTPVCASATPVTSNKTSFEVLPVFPFKFISYLPLFNSAPVTVKPVSIVGRVSSVFEMLM